MFKTTRRKSPAVVTRWNENATFHGTWCRFKMIPVSTMQLMPDDDTYCIYCTDLIIVQCFLDTWTLNKH